MLIGWLWYASVCGATGLFGLSPNTPIPSISPYSDVDLPATLQFTRRSGKPWIKAPLRSLVVTAYTDQPRLWTPHRYRSAMTFARWYLARCQIALPIVPLRVLPTNSLTPKGLVSFRSRRDLRKTKDPNETLLLFTKSVVYRWGRPPKRYPLLGLSARMSMQVPTPKGRRWIVRPTVWTRLSPVYTTLAHEIGHRLGLRHTRKPYHLMLNGPGVRSSFVTLWTSMLGYFEPKRFLFSARQCRVMQQTLRAERQKMLRGKSLGRIRILRPLRPLPRKPSSRPGKHNKRSSAQ